MKITAVSRVCTHGSAATHRLPRQHLLLLLVDVIKIVARIALIMHVPHSLILFGGAWWIVTLNFRSQVKMSFYSTIHPELLVFRFSHLTFPGNNSGPHSSIIPTGILPVSFIVNPIKFHTYWA